MKVLVIVLGLVIFGLIYLVFFGGNKEITNYPPTGTSIVAFGDSLIEGVGATEGNDLVSLLEKRTNTQIINLGKSGDTTRDGLLRLNEVSKQDPKIVLLLLGGNDYLRKIPQEETFSNLGKIIEEVQAGGAVVVLLGVRGGLLNDNYEEDFKDLAEDYGTAYVSDVLSGVFAHPELMSDTIHPNDAGYKLIADRVSPILDALLE